MLRRIIIIVISLIGSTLLFAQQEFTLEECIGYGIDHSRDIELNRLAIEDAQTVISETKAQGLPNIDASAGYKRYFITPGVPFEDNFTPGIYQVLSAEDIRNGNGDPISIPDFGSNVSEVSFFRNNNVDLNLNFRMLLFDGSYLEGVKAAKVYKEFTSKDIEVTEERIKANITKAYLNVLILEKRSEFLDDDILIIKKNLNETQQVYEAGFTGQLDVDRLQLSLNTLTTAKAEVDNFILVSKNALKYAMAYPLDHEIGLTDALEPILSAKRVQDFEEELDLNNKAVYRKLVSSTELNQLNMNRYKKGYLPSLAMSANYGQSLQRDKLFSTDELGWIDVASVGFSLNVPIYDGGFKKAKIQQSRIDLDEIEIQKYEFERATRLEIDNAKLMYNSALAQLENVKKNMDLSQSIYDKTQIKFKEGIGSSIEFTQAESQLYQFQNQYIDAMYDVLLAIIDWELAMGKL